MHFPPSYPEVSNNESSTLLAVFLYITVRMQGVMFTSLLGEAIGWRRNSIRKLILAEGLYTGIAAMIYVVIVATGSVFFLYRELTVFGVTLIILSSLIPILTGLIGTLIPAERASRLTPMNGIRGVQKTSVKKEKILRRGMVVAMAVFVTAFGTVIASCSLDCYWH